MDEIRDKPFPVDAEEAKTRFGLFKRFDPLPDVKPALLNAADIYDYARITGMICPFQTDDQLLKKKLKPASYEVDFLGDIHYLNEKGERRLIEINQDTPFTLPKNSIVYVFLRTRFFLPDYIALRFNLKITHVHRGLLLGTGPLVDPGFSGQLLIPLHNLTSKDYQLTGGDGLIWVEFTKLSPHPNWDSSARKDAGDHVHFHAEKCDPTAQKYFNKASDGKPSTSSIPETLEKAVAIEKKFQIIAWGGGITVFLTVVGLISATWSLISDANKNVSDSAKVVIEYQKSVDALHESITKLDSELKEAIATDKLDKIPETENRFSKKRKRKRK